MVVTSRTVWKESLVEKPFPVCAPERKDKVMWTENQPIMSHGNAHFNLVGFMWEDIHRGLDVDSQEHRRERKARINNQSTVGNGRRGRKRKGRETKSDGRGAEGGRKRDGGRTEGTRRRRRDGKRTEEGRKSGRKNDERLTEKARKRDGRGAEERRKSDGKLMEEERKEDGGKTEGQQSDGRGTEGHKEWLERPRDERPQIIRSNLAGKDTSTNWHDTADCGRLDTREPQD